MPRGLHARLCHAFLVLLSLHIFNAETYRLLYVFAGDKQISRTGVVGTGRNFAGICTGVDIPHHPDR